MNDRSAGTRGAWRIVARRELVERVREKSFAISTAVTLVILIAVIVISSVLGGDDAFELGVVGQGSESVGQRVEAAARAADIDMAVRSLRDEAAAERAVRDGEVDAALFGTERILVQSDPPAELVGVVQAVSLQMRSDRALAEAGLEKDEIRSALDQPPLPVRALEPVDEEERENSTVAFIAVIVLYGQIFGYGFWVSSGVLEEKSSRVVEVLLATVSPSQLLRGKVLGIGVLGLVQLLLIGVVGLAAAQIAGALSFPSGAIATIGLALLWFVLGYFFYAGLFAVAGSIVTRQEDLQTVMTPLTIVIVASLLIGISATENPSSTLAVVASLLPPSAPLVMPSRIVLGDANVLLALASVAISVAATAALFPIATSLYSRAVLQTGRVRLRALLGLGRA